MEEWTLRHRFASPQGTVRWDCWGAGEPVVLLHGTPFSSFVWRDVAAALAHRHRVYVWDMPGFGQSEMGEEQEVSLAAQARVFAALLRHFELDRPAVVAHDVGGAVALRAHLLHEADYARLALVDPVAVAPWGSPFFRLVGGHAPVFEQLPAALHEALVGAYVASASARGLHPRVARELVRPWLGERGQAAFYRQIAQAEQRHTDEIEPRYADLQVPVLLVWGTEDAWVPPERGERLASLVPGARLHRIAGAGHLVQEDAPAALTAALLDFLAPAS